MGQAIPTQHPAVVLRSHYKHMRALLAVAMTAVAGLTAAVVILATNDETDTSGSSVSTPGALTAQEKRLSAYEGAIGALTPEQLAAAVAAVTTSQPRPTEEQTFPGLARQAQGALGGSREDNGRAEGLKRPGPSTD